MPFIPDSKPTSGFIPDAPAAQEPSKYGEGQSFSERIADPNRWKAIAGMKSPAAPDVVEGSPPMTVPAGLAPSALMKLSAFLTKNPVTRIATGAVQGAASDPEHPVRGAAVGAGLGTAGEVLGALFGKGADVGMQAAVGRNKYTPGVGTTLADEGLWGTRRRMQDQVAGKLAERGQQISSAASQIPADITNDSMNVATSIAKDASRPYLVPGGQPSVADMPRLGTVRDFAQDIASRGAETGDQVLARRIAAGTRSYNGKENPLQSLLGKMSKQEQVHYSTALKDMGDLATAQGSKYVGPASDSIRAQIASEAPSAGKGLGDTLREADASYGALKRAEKGLNSEVSMPHTVFQALTGASKTLPGGAIAASSLAQALSKGGKAIESISDPMIRKLILEKASKAQE